MSDALVAPVWLAVHIFLLCAGWQYARRAFREASCFLRIAATVVFWWAALTVVGLLLGMAGVLTGPNLLTGYGTVAVAALLLLRFGAVDTWLAGEPRLTLQPPLE